MSVRRPSRRRSPTTFELARSIAPNAEALLELQRRFLAEEQRLAAALGPDDPPTFSDFVAWIVERGSRPPHRPKGRRDRHPDAHLRRSQGQLRRQRAAREAATSDTRSRVAA